MISVHYSLTALFIIISPSWHLLTMQIPQTNTALELPSHERCISKIIQYILHSCCHMRNPLTLSQSLHDSTDAHLEFQELFLISFID